MTEVHFAMLACFEHHRSPDCIAHAVSQVSLHATCLKLEAPASNAICVLFATWLVWPC